MVGLSQVRNTVERTTSNMAGAKDSNSTSTDLRMGRGECAKVRAVWVYTGLRWAATCAFSHWCERRQAFSSEVASSRKGSSLTPGSSDQPT